MRETATWPVAQTTRHVPASSRTLLWCRFLFRLIKIGDDGEPDAKQIKKAIEDLLKEKPYLGANGAGQGWGDVGGGGHSTPPADVEPGLGRLRHAYATESKTK